MSVLFAKKQILAVILLVLVTAAVFYPVLGHQFLGTKDSEYLTALPHSQVNGLYTPLTIFSYNIERHFAGLNPFIYHLDNLLLHILTVVLVFIFLSRLNLSFAFAFGAALIFAIHPSRAEPVASLVGRKDLLYACLYVGSLISYIKGRQVFSIGLGVLSGLANPMAITLPLMLVFLDWYKDRRFDANRLLAKWPFMALLVVIAFFSFKDGIQISLSDGFLYLPALGLCILAAYLLERIYIFLKGQEALICNLFLVALLALVLGLGILTHQQSKIWRDSITYWQYKIKHFPNADAYNNLAQEYRRMPQRDENVILDLTQKAVIADARRKPDYYNNLADFYVEIGRLEEAQGAYTSALEVDKKSKDAYFGLASVYQSQGQTAKVVGMYNQLATLFPDDEDLYIQIIEGYGKAIEANPNEKIYQEKREELLSSFEQLSRRKKYTAVDFYNLGFLYQQVGGKEEALRYYSKALEIQPKYAQALYAVAGIYQAAGDLKTAMGLYQRLVSLHPDFSLGYLNLGIIFNALGHQDKAKQYYLKTVKIDPNNSRAYFNLGYLSEAQGDFQEAINYYERAIEENPNDGEVYFNLGNVYAHLGQSAEAIPMYLKTVEVNPNHQDAYVNLSILSFKLRDFQGAMRFLKEAQVLGYHAPEEYLRTLEPYRGSR